MVATGYLYVDDAERAFFRSRIPGSSSASLISAKTLRCSRPTRSGARSSTSSGTIPASRASSRYDGATPYNPAENTARIFWGLKPYDQRDATAEQIIQRLRKKVAGIEGAKFFMQVPQNITVGGRLSRAPNTSTR